MNQFSRTESIIGKDNMDKLQKSTIAIFGIGGVGSFVVEGLARAGVKNLILIDNDVISETNLNRQIHATINTINQNKVDIMKERILIINPDANVITYKLFYMPDTINEVDLSKCDYMVDAVDNVTAKIAIIEQSKKFNIPIISCMGTGNKLDNTKFKITDISKTTVCPLAKVMRKELKERDIKNVKVLFSTEEPVKITEVLENPPLGKHTVPGSISYMPSIAGLMICGEVIRDIIGGKTNG